MMHGMADASENLVVQLLRQLREDFAEVEQIAGLRRAMVECRSAVVGHGVLVSDLEGRVRRLEQKVGISAA